MIEEEKSILRASKETGLLYNAVCEIVYGKKCPGGTQYTQKDDPQARKCSIRKSTKMSKYKSPPRYKSRSFQDHHILSK